MIIAVRNDEHRYFMTHRDLFLHLQNSIGTIRSDSNRDLLISRVEYCVTEGDSDVYCQSLRHSNTQIRPHLSVDRYVLIVATTRHSVR